MSGAEGLDTQKKGGSDGEWGSEVDVERRMDVCVGVLVASAVQCPDDTTGRIYGPSNPTRKQSMLVYKSTDSRIQRRTDTRTDRQT